MRLSYFKQAYNIRLSNFYAYRLLEAMSMQRAKELLGFGAESNPSKVQIEKSYKQLALQHHPDRGGDPAKMVEINVARDVLEGRQRPTDPAGPSTVPSRPTYTTQTRPKPKPIRVTFREAMQQAKVPLSGVTWKFKTDSGYGRIRNGTSGGYVVYGLGEKEHIFVSIFYYQDSGDINQPLDIETYEMEVIKEPKTKKLAQVAPAVIRRLWKNFGTGVKQYNAKVRILPDNVVFEDVSRYGDRSVPFKTAIQQLGEDVPSSWKGKVEIWLEMGEEMTYQKTHPKLKWCYKCCRPILVVNGKEYYLNDKSAESFHYNDVYNKLWGKKYWYCNDRTSRKKLNMVKNAKRWLTQIANLCEKYGEPAELVAALRAAADKSKR